MKVLFDFAKQQIAIDGDSEHLLKVLGLVQQVAPFLTKIEINTSGVQKPALPSQPASEQAPAGSNGTGVMTGQTMRQFVRQLQLGNAYERAAAIAYYAKTYEGRQVFSPKELSEWFGFCGLAKPSQMPVTLSDAKRKYGYVDSIARGQWKLTTNGENLVIGKINAAEAAQQQS